MFSLFPHLSYIDRFRFVSVAAVVILPLTMFTGSRAGYVHGRRLFITTRIHRRRRQIAAPVQRGRWSPLPPLHALPGTDRGLPSRPATQGVW